jgi:hypothetical protein
MNAIVNLCEELLQGLVILDILNLIAQFLGCHQILQWLYHQALQLRKSFGVHVPRKGQSMNLKPEGFWRKQKNLYRNAT